MAYSKVFLFSVFLAATLFISAHYVSARELAETTTTDTEEVNPQGRGGYNGYYGKERKTQETETEVNPQGRSGYNGYYGNERKTEETETQTVVVNPQGRGSGYNRYYGHGGYGHGGYGHSVYEAPPGKDANIKN